MGKHKQRALVLAGGGSRGSWQAGALRYMGEVSDQLWPEGFDFGSGTSVGAINISGIGMFPPGQFKEATEYTETMWREHMNKTKDVWSLRFPLGLPAFWQPSAGTNSQLASLLAKIVDIEAIQKSGVEIRYAAVDVESGELVIYKGSDLVDHGVDPIMASASYPMAFPPVEIGDQWLTDGGVRDTAPVGAAIQAGVEEIVVLTTRPMDTAGDMARSEINNTVEFGIRCLSIQFHEVLENDIKWCRQHNHWARLPQVLRDNGVGEAVVERVVAEMQPKKHVKLTVLCPSRMLGTSLDFSKALMDEQIDLGYEDAKAQLSHLL